jgi:hypothetical protein
VLILPVLLSFPASSSVFSVIVCQSRNFLNDIMNFAYCDF